MNLDLSKNIYDGEPDSPPSTVSATSIELKPDKDTAFVVEDQLDITKEIAVPGIAIKKETARSQIALIYVSSFLLIIALVFLFSSFKSLSNDDIKDLLVTISGIMSGPLGFIIGYYFKSADE